MHTRLILTAVLAVVFSNIAQADAFSAHLELQGVTFQVESPNDSSINRVVVCARTSAGPLSTVEAEADGTITNVEAADLNADGYPEIYIFVTSAGSGSYGSLIGYASNRNKSLSQIYLPPVAEDPEISQGYMGHDKFHTGDHGRLVRQFPVYRDGDSNAAPGGGTRQVQYELIAGEAGWLLRRDAVLMVRD